ncbi:MAG: SusC/RagA family TonB-linked outer membrane protein [Bacteroidota bacterium]
MKKIYFLKYVFPLLFMFLCGRVLAQSGTITGRITDEGNLPLPGATVTVKGTTNSAAADINGYYKLSNISAGNQVITASFIGYKQLEQTVNVSGAVTANLQLQPASVQLNEIAVIGYGVIRKSDATGSVDVLTAKDFNKGAVNSIQDAISGKLPGVAITSTSGAPGNTSTIRIRGNTSINASSAPLIVVDNVPISNIGLGGMANILTSINPNDVENITVLKDASATAIYGSRGSSGVILITTKRGSKKTTINYNVTGSESVIPKTIDVYTGDQFRSLINQVYAGQSAVTSLLGKSNTNWQDEIYHSAFAQDHNLSVSGTSGNMPYRVSLGYNNSDGILKTYNFKRTTAAIGLDPSLFNHSLNIHINIKGLYNTNNFADQAAIGGAVNYDPTQPVTNGNTRWRGYTTWTTNGNTNINGPAVALATANPLARLNETDNTSTARGSIGNVQFDYKMPFLPELRANANLGYDYSIAFGKNNVKDSTGWITIPVASGGRFENYNTVHRNTLSEFYLNYKKNFKNIESVVDVTAGYSYSHFYTEGNDIAYDYRQTTLNFRSPYKTEYNLESFFGRANYTFKDRYELTFTVRDDGTSKFAPQNRFGVFPAGAFAWRLMNEDFMKGSKTFSDLKLRLGYGTTGQQDLLDNDNYPYQARFSRSNASARYQFGNEFYYTQRPEGYDAGIKWESTTTANIGLDFGFFNNRLTGSIDAYNKKTSNLLIVTNVPVLSNFSSVLLQNVASMTNNGAELNLTGVIIDHGDVNWQLGYNISYNKNKVTKLNNSNNNPDFIQTNPSSGIAGTTSGLIQANKVGYPLNSFYVFQQIYNANGKPIEDGYVDRNHDGQINSADQYLYKKPDPTVLMGINSSVHYKKFDFNFSGRLSLGNYNYNNVASGSTYRGLYSSLGYLSNQTTAADDTKFTNALQTNLSDYYIQNASFFRMDNMNIGYMIPTPGQKFKLHVSAGVQNVFVITGYKGLDPEVSGGLDNNFFPRARIYQLGLNCNFQ